MIEPPNRDGDYGCVCCGERWPSETRREWLDRITAESCPDGEIQGPKRGRPRLEDSIITYLSDGRSRTTSEIADAMTASRSTVEQRLWSLLKLGRIAGCESKSGRTWERVA